MILRSFAVAACAAAALAFPAAAGAELVTLRSGRTLSVRAVEVSGDETVLSLRGGGQLVCATSLIARIAPDEVEHPEPEVGTALRAVHTPDPHQDGSESRPYHTSHQDGSESRPYQESRPYVERAKAYDAVVARAARRHNVDPKLVHAVIAVESGYQPRARSSKGALGMMQLMPATARDLRVRNPLDAAANIEGGVRHLRQLLDRFELRLALAAYNAGAATVERFGGIPPYPETRAYVSRVLQLAGVS